MVVPVNNLHSWVLGRLCWLVLTKYLHVDFSVQQELKVN